MKNNLFLPLKSFGMTMGPSISKPKSFHLKGETPGFVAVNWYGSASKALLRTNSKSDPW